MLRIDPSGNSHVRSMVAAHLEEGLRADLHDRKPSNAGQFLRGRTARNVVDRVGRRWGGQHAAQRVQS